MSAAQQTLQAAAAGASTQSCSCDPQSPWLEARPRVGDPRILDPGPSADPRIRLLPRSLDERIRGACPERKARTQGPAVEAPSPAARRLARLLGPPQNRQSVQRWKLAMAQRLAKPSPSAPGLVDGLQGAPAPNGPSGSRGTTGERPQASAASGGEAYWGMSFSEFLRRVTLRRIGRRLVAGSADQTVSPAGAASVLQGSAGSSSAPMPAPAPPAASNGAPTVVAAGVGTKLGSLGCANSLTWDRDEATWSLGLDTLEEDFLWIGCSLGDLDKIDQWIMCYMVFHIIPNCSVSVVSGDGRLVYAKGFTYPRAFELIEASTGGEGIPTELFECTPDTQFRMNSISKSITSVAIHQLWENNVFTLWDDFLSLASGGPLMPASMPLTVTPDGTSTARDLQDITVSDLLRHRAGWCDRDPCVDWQDKFCDGTEATIPPEWEYALDPLASDFKVLGYLHKAMGKEGYPVGISQIISFAFSSEGYALKNTNTAWAPPGEVKQYSGFGYCLLGRVIDQQAGPYRTYIEKMIFSPLGMTNSGWAQNDYALRGANEVAYYPPDSAKRFDNLGGGKTKVFEPYGGARNWSNVDAPGGVVSSTVDMARLLNALRRDGGNLNPALFASVDTIANMQDNSRGWVHDASTWYRGVVPGSINWIEAEYIRPVYHTGTSEGSGSSWYMFPPHSPLSGSGTSDYLYRTRLHDNAAFALAFNRTRDRDHTQLWELLRTYLAEHMGQTDDPDLHVTDWGTDDLFR